MKRERQYEFKIEYVCKQKEDIDIEFLLQKNMAKKDQQPSKPKVYTSVIDRFTFLFKFKNTPSYSCDIDLVVNAFPNFSRDFIIHSLEYWGMLDGRKAIFNQKEKTNELPKTLF